jgi:hypothetical protein
VKGNKDIDDQIKVLEEDSNVNKCIIEIDNIRKYNMMNYLNNTMNMKINVRKMLRLGY